MPSRHFQDFAPEVLTSGPVPDLVDAITAGASPSIPPELVEPVAASMDPDAWEDYLRRVRRATQ